MGKCDADSGILISACLPVSQCLRSDARCCDAGSRIVSPACPCVSRLSPCVSQGLCGQMPDAVTPAPGWCLPPVSLSPSLCGQMPDAVCLPKSLRSDASQMLDVVSPCLPVPCVPVSHSKARCCDAGCGVVSPACVSQGLCSQMPDAVTLAAGSCLPLISLCLPVSAVRC